MYLSGTFYIFTIDRFKTLLTKSNNKGSETPHIHIAPLLSDVLVMKIGLFMIFHRLHKSWFYVQTKLLTYAHFLLIRFNVIQQINMLQISIYIVILS